MRNVIARAALLLLLAAALAPAQTYQLKWSVLSSGGAKMASASYIARGTAGQGSIGKGTSTSYIGWAGFWVPEPGRTGPHIPAGWYPLSDSMTGTPVKDGGGLAFSSDNGLIYELKGNKSYDFNAYNPADSGWQSLTSVPAGLKPVSKGAALTAGGGYVFVMKGNSTREFYKYNVTTHGWAPDLRPIPLALDQNATRGKTVKGGGGLAYVSRHDSDFVYVLKGSGTVDFFRYSVAQDSYRSIPNMPYNTRAKYDKGSWIAYDGSRYIYLMQNKYNALYRYDVTTEAWDPTSLMALPFIGRAGRTKKVGDGSCAAWDGASLRTLKGNNTQEWWRYTPSSGAGTWSELETIPQAYTGGKKKKPKAGAGLAYYPDWGLFYAQKGNKTNQFWMYSPGTELYAERRGREGVATAEIAGSNEQYLRIGSSPLAGGSTTLRYSLPKAGTVDLSVHDVSGRLVMTRMFSASRAGATDLDLRNLSAGVYLVKLTSDGFAATQKLVIER
jgi:hypothetical protein